MYYKVNNINMVENCHGGCGKTEVNNNSLPGLSLVETRHGVSLLVIISITYTTFQSV